MEIDKSCFVEIEEGLWLPIGFKFRPNDEELIVHYLKSKIDSFPLPASIIPEHQVFDTNPWDLPGDLEEKRYFFSKREEDVKNCRSIVQAGCGYWKQIGPYKVVDSTSMDHYHHHQIVGMKRTLVFCQRKHPERIKSCWIMHQFFLVDSMANLSSPKNVIMQTGDWVACCIFKPKLIVARKKQQV